MAEESRPPDWDWVKATHQCSAQAMFGELRALARRDIKTRNEQLERDAFKLTELNGTDFLISKDGSRTDMVSFKVTDDLNRISIASERNRERTVYTIGLDNAGICKFQHDGNQLDAWQVLKLALGLMFFGE